VPRYILHCLVGLICLTPALATAMTPSMPSDDPYESFNRKSFAFSLKLDRAVVGPLARVSAGLTPAPVMKALHNILVNLSEPVVILNDLLQFRPERALKATTRLAINSSFGLVGALDLAAKGGITHEDNGFGDTLGRYGVKAGPYLFVPILGPSDFRDLIGRGVDEVSTPLFYLSFPYNTEVNSVLPIIGGLDERAMAGPQIKALLSDAADPYATLRSTYLQSREAEIRGDTALPPLPDIDAAPATPASAAPSVIKPISSSLQSAAPPSAPWPGRPPSPATSSGLEFRSPDPAPA
jgi:phospholipid-binding lipoprotein MlaA